MEIPLNFVYLVAIMPMVIIWLVLFFLRKDLRKEIWIISIYMAFLSVVTAHYWWTIDWWQPLTIWGTRVGIEDFILGFFAGGLMTALYEVIFKKRLYKRKGNFHENRGLVLILLLVLLMSWLFWGIGLTSFVSSSISMLIVSILMIIKRKDLFFDALGSGVLVTIASLPSYYLAMFVNSEWIDATYPMLSGIRITGIPVEELIFWFIAGFLFGPFYEYWQGKRLRKISNSSSNFVH